MEAVPQRLVFYDGDCGLCQKSVQWALDHDAEGKLRFAPLQGETAKELLENREDLPRGADSVVFLEEGKLYLRSKAVFNIAKHLDGGVRWLRFFRWIPSFLTDLGYRFIAAIRFRVWGKADVCRIPTPNERVRFLP